MSPEEYLERDQRDPWKNEFIAGRMVAMPHPNANHVLIATQTGATLRGQLKDTAFWAAMMRMRLHVPAASYYTFPDLMILREPGRFVGEGENVSALDPIVILEVYSPETEATDRGERFARYRLIPSLSDYLLIAQAEPRVEHFARRDDDRWERNVHSGLNAVANIPSVGCTLRLADVYERIVFPETTTFGAQEA